MSKMTPHVCARIEIPKWQIVEEVIARVAKNNKMCALAIRIAWLTGLRASDQRALRWKHVDFEHGTVSVKTKSSHEARNAGDTNVDL